MTRRLLVSVFLPILAICALMAVPAQSAGFKDPVALVKALYALPDLWQSVSQDAASRQKYLSPALSKLVSDNRKLPSENQLDYDALVDGQDNDLAELKVTLVQSVGAKASVRAEFKNGGKAKKVTLELVSIGGEWRLDDITYADHEALADDLDFMNKL